MPLRIGSSVAWCIASSPPSNERSFASSLGLAPRSPPISSSDPMPAWTSEYHDSLQTRFTTLSTGLADRLDAVVAGRVPPGVDDIAIGSARHLRAAVLFFDIRGFSTRTGSPDVNTLKRTLLM